MPENIDELYVTWRLMFHDRFDIYIQNLEIYFIGFRVECGTSDLSVWFLIFMFVDLLNF